ncbi:MAG: hypothetical protein ACRDIU_00885 [Actinomycetota bacterium]
MKRRSKILAGTILGSVLLVGLSSMIPGAAQTKMSLTAGIADANGNFSISVKIPDGTDPGTYDLRASCPASGTGSTPYPPQSGSLTVSTTTVTPGQTIVASGTGCLANAIVTVDLVFISAAARLSLAGTAEAQTTTRTLTARITVRAPATTAPVAAATTAAGAATPRGKLSATGFPALPFLLAGLAALAVGSGLIVAARRRDQKGQSTAGS